PVSILRAPMSCIAMSQRVTATNGSRPPLAEAHDLRIVGRHRLVDLDDRIAREAETDSEIRLLSGDRLLVETADVTECRNADHHDPAEAAHIFDLPRGRSPFDGAQAIVDRGLGMALRQVTGDDRALRVPGKGLKRGWHEPGLEFAIPIDEHDKGSIRPATEYLVHALIAAARRREWARRFELDCRGTEFASQVGTSVGGARIGVNGGESRALNGAQAQPQQFPLVPADDDRSDIGPGYSHRRSIHAGACPISASGDATAAVKSLRCGRPSLT